MNLEEAIESRTSIRKFSDKKVDTTDLKKIVKLAGLAPSINNYQPWKFYAISNTELLKKMADKITLEIVKMPEGHTRLAKHLKNQAVWFSTFFREAPVLIALAGKPYETDLEKGVQISHDDLNKIRNYPDLQSAGACIQNLLLAATAMGYGACWMSGPLFAKDELEKILQIEQPWSLITFVALGHPGDKQAAKEKRDLSEEMVLFD